ncbi:head-tail adaptor protein [Brevundimonas mediterranea]|uniref:head-tail adaptor protein n=1 Tax=Brevundimonas mediterranea TaxID=74329 RepID=UPI0040335C54
MGLLGKMRGKVRFDRLEETRDEYNSPVGVWVTFATVAARVRYMRGGESVLAQRLTGVQPVVVTVRSTASTRDIKLSDRAIDTRTGDALNIESLAPDERGAFIEILCEATS